MTQSSLIVERVVLIGTSRIALQVQPIDGLDLQYIYRAALSVYWAPKRRLLEDRYKNETSSLLSFKRIARALDYEYGLQLKPADNLEWEGFDPKDQKAIEDIWSTKDFPQADSLEGNSPCR